MGLVREQMTAAQQADMAAHLPPPVTVMWDGGGQAQFLQFMSQVRNTAA